LCTVFDGVTSQPSSAALGRRRFSYQGLRAVLTDSFSAVYSSFLFAYFSVFNGTRSGSVQLLVIQRRVKFYFMTCFLQIYHSSDYLRRLCDFLMRFSPDYDNHFKSINQQRPAYRVNTKITFCDLR